MKFLAVIRTADVLVGMSREADEDVGSTKFC